jgi:deoxycytidine triphosphate deaminase
MIGGLMKDYNGRLMSKTEIMKLIGKEINIDPFEQEKLKNPWYALHPKWAWVDAEGRYTEPLYDKIEIIRDSPFILDSHCYVEIEIDEKIILKDGIVGMFIPASHSIEDGLIVNVGKLDSNYRGMIKFGVFNAKSHEVAIHKTSPLAYLSFFDLRNNDVSSKSNESDYDRNIKKMREAKTIDEFVNSLKKFLLEQK